MKKSHYVGMEIEGIWIKCTSTFFYIIKGSIKEQKMQPKEEESK